MKEKGLNFMLYKSYRIVATMNNISLKVETERHDLSEIKCQGIIIAFLYRFLRLLQSHYFVFL